MVSVAARPLVTVAPRRAGAASEQRLLDPVVTGAPRRAGAASEQRLLDQVAPRRACAASEQRLLDQVDFQHAAVQTLPQVRASVTGRASVTWRRDCRLWCIGAGGQIQFREEE